MDHAVGCGRLVVMRQVRTLLYQNVRISIFSVYINIMITFLYRNGDVEKIIGFVTFFISELNKWVLLIYEFMKVVKEGRWSVP